MSAQLVPLTHTSVKMVLNACTSAIDLVSTVSSQLKEPSPVSSVLLDTKLSTTNVPWMSVVMTIKNAKTVLLNMS